MLGMVFVFGSNLAGRHGLGAARTAVKDYGAIPGRGSGRQRDSYAIPTKDASLLSLPLEEIQSHIKTFFTYVKRNPGEVFLLTPIGTGLAGYTARQMMELLNDCGPIPANVVLHSSWLDESKW